MLWQLIISLFVFFSPFSHNVRAFFLSLTFFESCRRDIFKMLMFWPRAFFVCECFIFISFHVYFVPLLKAFFFAPSPCYLRQDTLSDSCQRGEVRTVRAASWPRNFTCSHDMIVAKKKKKKKEVLRARACRMEDRVDCITFLSEWDPYWVMGCR
jgi:hypothetical protein